MATPEEQLQAAADLATEAADRADGASEQIYEFANGDENTQVVTDNGLVDTIAKLAADFRAEIVGQTLKATIEEQTLSAGQTTVSTTEISMPPRPILFVEGSFEQDFEVTGSNTIELGQSYPDGTTIWILQNVPTEVDDLQTLVDQAQVFADEAEGYRDEAADLVDQASAAANIFESTVEGLSNTQPTGDVDRYFSTPSADGEQFLDLYKNESGIAEFVDSYPNSSALTQTIDTVDRLVDTATYTFDSVAAMKADTRLRVGDRVRTLGYYEPGDGGGRDYLVVSPGTATNLGFIYEALEGAGLEAKLLGGGIISGESVYVPTDYPTLQAAFDDLSKLQLKNGGSIDVVIEPGHVLSQALVLNGGDYSQFTLSSEDAEVVISAPSDVRFLRFTNCNAPTINLILDGSGEVEEIYRYESSRGVINEGCGGKNTYGRVCYVSNTMLRAGESAWHNYEEIFCTQGSGASFGGAVMIGATRAAIVFAEGATGAVSSCDIQDCAIGIHIKDGAVVDAEFAVVQRSSNEAVRVDDASITLDGAQLLDCQVESINMIAGSCRAPDVTITSLSSSSSIIVRGGCRFSGSGTITGSGTGTGIEVRGGDATTGLTVTGFDNGLLVIEGGKATCRGAVIKDNSNLDIRLLHGSWVSAGGCETTSSATSGNYPDVSDTEASGKGGFNALLTGGRGILWA